MRTKIFTLASSVAVVLLALTSLQGTAQAYEYHRYHIERGENRDHDRDRNWFRFSSHRYWDHDRR